MAEIRSNQFTTTINKEAVEQPPHNTYEIRSNQFTTTINKEAVEQPPHNTYEIRSNQFTATINRGAGGGGAGGGGAVTEQTAYNTQVIMYKGKQMLTPVSNTPSSGQYQVTIINTVNCEAQLERDHKTITVLRTTGNSGRIDISINVENIKTYTKSISVVTVVSTGIVKEVYTQYKQLSDKFTWLVKSGDSQSTMQLTDKMYELISKNINLTADRINLNGYVSNDEANWSIDIDGNMETKNMNVEGDLSADTISCNNLNSPKYPATLDGNLEIYVNSSTGNDDNEPNDDVRFKTLQGAIDAIPKFLNGKTVYITLETNTTEDVYIRGIVGGAVRIYMNGKTLYGTLRSYVCSCSISVYGGTSDSTEGATGIIHPNVGLSFGSRAVSVGFEASQYAALYKVKVFAPDTIPSGVSSTEKVCVASQAGTGSVYCKHVEIVNAVIGFRSNNHGSMHVNSSSGVASKYGFQSATGGIISIANNNQCGGKTSSTNKGSGGQVWYDANGPTFATGNQTTDSGSAPVVSGTKTITIKSSYGDTYRSSVYKNWKKDGTVRQGDYGYGDCTGCWFFGSAFSELKGCTISKVQITITRQTGGSSVPVEHKLWMHGHTGRPSGAPTLTSGWSQTFRLATGNSTTVTITDSTVLNAISAGTCKGFALRHTYDSVHYSVCSGNVTVKITYTE